MACLAACLAGIAASEAAAAGTGAAQYYEDALARYERRDIAGSIVQLKNALQIDRRLLPVQVLLGKALLANGEAVAAEVALAESLRLGVDRAEVVLPLARAYIAQGKQQLVLDQPQFQAAGLRADVNLPLLLLRSACAADLGDARGALKAIDEARALDPKSADPWLAEVPVRIRMRQFREAGAAADKALSLAPKSADGWYQKGSVAHVAGDVDAALAAYDRALGADPAHIETRVARAGLRLDAGRAADAGEDVAELRRLSPREPRGAYLAALLAERDGRADGARAALAEVTALIDPVPLDFIRWRPQLLMLGGLAHFGLGEREKSKPYLEAFQKAHGASPVAKLLARIAMAEGNVERAIELLEPYAKAQPGDAQALSLLASALMSQGRHARATALLQDALRMRDNADFRTGLGLSLLGGGRAADAIAELEAAFGRDASQTQAGAALVALHLRAGQTAKALGAAQRLARQQPANAAFANLLGLARARSGDAVGARAAFEQALKLDGTLAHAHLNLARLDLASNAVDAAGARLAAFLKTEEKNVEALMEMARVAERRGQTAEAQGWLEKAAAHAAARDAAPGVALVEFHLRHGQAAPALEAARRIASKAPDDIAVLVASAKAQLADRDAAAARTTLANAGRRAAADAPLLTEIALLQVAADDVDGAAYVLDKALADAPDFAPAIALLGEVRLRQGDAARAEQRARQLVQRHPGLAVGHTLLGDVAFARGQSAAALDAYRQAHRVQPSTATLLRLVRALGPDNGPAALRLAEQWAAARPKDATAHKALGDGHARLSDYRAARTAYERALALAPQDAEVLNNLANVLMRLNDPQAVQVAELALSLRPGDADVIDTVGWAHHLAGRLERALPLLRDARLRRPASPDIRYHLAAALAKSGRRAEARDELKAALDAGRRFEGAAEAEALLRSLQ